VFTSQNLLDDSMEEKGTVSDLDSWQEMIRKPTNNTEALGLAAAETC
jgi:hypothetical protein